MKRKNHLLKTLLILIAIMGLGYAFLTQDLTINGTSKVKGNTWDIHFDNLQIRNNSVTLSEGDVAAHIVSNNNTLVEYTITLKEPGQFYEFTVDVVNAGTIDGMIDSIVSKYNNVEISTTNPIPDYLNYSITYDDGITITPNHLLRNGETERYKIRIEYKKDITSNQLPTTLQTLSFSFNVEYVQADSNGIDRPKTLYGTVARQVDLTKTIDFSQASSYTNGKGVYRFPGTENNDYPVYYFRGEVYNNNVIFGNGCWKIVRTTDTGGTKLVYSQKYVRDYIAINETEYEIIENRNLIFYSSDNSWNISTNQSLEKVINFTVPEGKYKIKITGTTTTSSGISFTIYKDSMAVNGSSNGGGNSIDYTYDFGDLTSSNTIKVSIIPYASQNDFVTLKIQMLKLSNDGHCSNDDSITNSKLYSGSYMYGNTLTTKRRTRNNVYVSDDFTYDKGTGKYTLVNPVSSGEIYKKYSCFSLNTISCTTLYYIRYGGTTDQNEIAYIELNNGDSFEDYFNRIYQNTNDSEAKQKIDTWYQQNMLDYTNYLEDIVWCNDRRFTRSTYTFYSYDNIITNNSPSIMCARLIDSFTVSPQNGNGALTYPVGLLTADEITMAGLVGQSTETYLNNYSRALSMTPSKLIGEVFVYDTYKYSTESIAKIRPAISLKHNMIITGGNGTIIKPYKLAQY